jgi:hypothetical protein
MHISLYVRQVMLLKAPHLMHAAVFVQQEKAAAALAVIAA